MKTFDLKDLRCFLETAATGGITRAAERLHTTQSALSRRLHNLENGLGVTVFIRESTGVRLTPAGRRLQRLATPLLENADRIWNTIASEKRGLSSRINVGMVSGVSQTIHAAMKQFRRDYSEIALNLREGASEHLQNLVLSNDLDLAVITNPRPTKGLSLIPLWCESIYIAGPKARARGGKLRLRDLVDLPFIQATRSLGMYETLKDAFEREGVAFTVAFEIESIATIRRMIAEGDAYSILSYPTIGSEVESETIALCQLPNAFITRTLIRKINGARSPGTKAFVQLLRHEAGKVIRSKQWAFPAR